MKAKTFITSFVAATAVLALIFGLCVVFNSDAFDKAYSALHEFSEGAGTEIVTDENKAKSATVERKNNDERTLVCVMYHNILKSRNGKYIVSPKQFEDDLAAYRDAGFTTVFPSEIADFVYGDGELPEKPLLITFDDGKYNNMFYGLPLLEKYDAKAEMNPVGAFTEFSASSGDHSNPNYSHVTWEQIGELHKSGRFELGNHSYNMHRYKPRFGIMPKVGENPAEYRKTLKEDTGRLQDKILCATGELPLTYAYPFGEYNDDALAVLRGMGFKLFLTCNEGVSIIRRGAPESLFLIKRANRDGSLTSAEMTQRLRLYAKKAESRAEANRG